MKIAFFASHAPNAQNAYDYLTKRYSSVSVQEADCLVALGGDGFLLKMLHHPIFQTKPIYGMNLGTVGFLMNPYQLDDLPERIAVAQSVDLHPLLMKAYSLEGALSCYWAVNEVSILRQTSQSAKIQIWVDGLMRIPELVSDGILLATPAGSSAYNLSVYGPILPLDSNLLALTPISPFRPRRWRGAILPSTCHVCFEIVDPHKRPVLACADDKEVKNIGRVEIHQDKNLKMRLLFDPDQSLQERIMKEQFLT
jgi:NAD+ kinase